jgi:hypothetical protein
MIYIVDIDQTICFTPKDDNGTHLYKESMPYRSRIKHLNSLYAEGHTIIYWTARGATSGIDWTDFTKSQLDDWGVLYTEVRLGKPNYDIWVDDKAFNDEDFFDE